MSKDFTEAIKYMFLFKKGYSRMPRWMQIAYGIIGWLSLIIAMGGTVIKVYRLV